MICSKLESETREGEIPMGKRLGTIVGLFASLVFSNLGLAALGAYTREPHVPDDGVGHTG